MLSKAQEDALAAKLERERQERIAEKQAAKPRPSTTFNGATSDEEMDRQAARDGLNPGW